MTCPRSTTLHPTSHRYIKKLNPFFHENGEISDGDLKQKLHDVIVMLVDEFIAPALKFYTAYKPHQKRSKPRT
ncbi:hypothetical protein APHCRT_0673 [Anaplasma phagocytophilum str. CRT53-1]|uniref:Uncharacterized protein n=1 Tax=Anaplasma phagocytophilum str. CRT53-1 TaxID=1359157 RepID=A0A0F3Q1N6_ANAPH|nr:hypothetical protein APHCRT_0673 [Anaplasma phagocytophilum str. CRT53-1]